MAKTRAVTIKPTKFTDRLARASKEIHGIVEDALDEGGEYLEPKLRASMKAAIGRGVKWMPSRKTGTLLNSIGKSPVKENRRNGVDLKVGLYDPREPQPDYNLKNKPLTNAMIANVIEYGKKEVDQPAKPMLRPVYTTEHETVEHILYEAVERGVNNL